MTELEQMVVEVRVRFAAPPADVFALLHDVERMAGLGPEHHIATWTSPTTFTGHNRMGDREWQVPCHVLADEPPHHFAWCVGDPAHRSSTWSYEIEADGDGTVVTQRMQHGPGHTYLREFVEARPDKADRAIARRSEDLRQNMMTVLEAARLLLEG